NSASHATLGGSTPQCAPASTGSSTASTNTGPRRGRTLPPPRRPLERECAPDRRRRADAGRPGQLLRATGGGPGDVRTHLWVRGGVCGEGSGGIAADLDWTATP